MQKKFENVKPGDKLLLVSNYGHRVVDYEVTVTEVKRKWVHFGHRKDERFDKESGLVSGTERYASNGCVYFDYEDYQQTLYVLELNRLLWLAVARSSIFRLSAENIAKAAEAFGVELPDFATWKESQNDDPK